MRVSWMPGALDDVKSCVPKPFRKPLKDYLSNSGSYCILTVRFFLVKVIGIENLLPLQLANHL